MPIKTYNKNLKVPCDLIFNGRKYRALLDENYLTFVDFKTGLYNRIITRDPISGLGLLPPVMIDKFHMKLIRPKDNYNPILLTGNYRSEYNCLYTQKEYNNSINNNNSKDIKQSEYQLRDPISGLGILDIEYCVEVPPITIKHIKRDPIAHSVPIENMNEKPPRPGLGLSENHGIRRDPITHRVPIENMGERPFRPSLGAHDRVPASRNIITHNETNMNDPYTRGARHFHDTIKRRNPITHVDNNDKDVTFQSRRKPPQNSQEGPINPITHMRSYSRPASFTLDSTLKSPVASVKNTIPDRPLSRSKTVTMGERWNPITGQGVNRCYNLFPKRDLQSMSKPLNPRMCARNPITGEGYTEKDYLPSLPANAFTRSCDRPGKTVKSPVARSPSVKHSPSISSHKAKPIFSSHVKHSHNGSVY